MCATQGLAGFLSGANGRRMTISGILSHTDASPKAWYIRFWSINKMYYGASISIDIALREKTLMAYEFDREYLEEDYGGLHGPLCPVSGVANLKKCYQDRIGESLYSGF